MKHYFGILIAERVSIIALRNIDMPTLEHRGEVFVNRSTEYAADYITGFYDWIADSESIVGVRYMPFRVPDCLARIVDRCPFVSGDGDIFEIALPFGVPRNGATYLDQLFGDNAVFCSAGGSVIITCAMEGEDPLAPALALGADGNKAERGSWTP